MPSGKQVLLHLLEKYSQQLQNDEDLSEVSEDLRIALLLHGSTPPDMWFHVERMVWLTETTEISSFTSTKQGLGIKREKLFLSELFARMTESREIPENVQSVYPELSEDEYESATHVMWLLLKSLEFSSNLNEVEDNGKLDVEQWEKWKVSYRKKLAAFREDPAVTIGYDDEESKKKYKEKLDVINN